MAEGLVSQAEAPAVAPAVAGTPATAEAPPGAPASGTPTTPEEQKAYDSAMQMVSELLHNTDASSDQILKMLSEGDPVDTITTVVEFIVGKVEEAFQGNLPETIIAGVADETSDWVIELGEEGGAFDLTDQQIVQTKGAVVKAILEAYGGVEEGDMNEMMQGVSQEEVASYAQAFERQA